MFNVCMYMQNSDLYHCCVRDSHDLNRYLHSDGQVFNTPEYWPTKEAAQKILDKFYPKPEHVWEHGDVFKNSNGCIMICVANGALGKLKVYYLSTGYTVSCSADVYFDNAIFLFNIKEKL